MAERILEEVKKTIEEYKMFENIKKAVIGFSSGPDSVCLLDVLKTIYGNKINFILVYINHGLRAEKVLKKEEQLTEYYAKKYQCGLKIIKIKVVKSKRGIEAEAREKRYKVLTDYARKISAHRIILGHNLDDLIETFFLNLIRGSGNIGLQSIPPVRLPFARPLINVRKADILKYLKKRELIYSKDISNLDTNLRRNYIRHKIIPQFIKLNPNIYQTIKREIEILHNDEEFLQQVVDRVYGKVVSKREQGFTLDLNRLMNYNKAIRNRIIMKTLRLLKGDLSGIESKHIESIWSLNFKESGRKINLPHNLYAQKIFNRVFIGRESSQSKDEIDITLNIGKAELIGEIIVRAELVDKFDIKKRRVNCEFFDFSQISSPIFLRNRKAGDIIKIKDGVKKLKEILIEKKVPANERKSVLVLCDQDGILWVLGIYRAYRAFIKKNTKDILKVEFEHTFERRGY